MNRRSVLRRGSTLAFTFLAGCNGTQSSSSTTSPPNGTPSSTTERPTASTTTAPDQTGDEKTPNLVVEQRYPLGESHSVRDWTIAVTSVPLETTFQLDHDQGTFQMPEDEQLAVVTVQITNRTDSQKAWTDAPFVLIADAGLFYEQLGFDHPDFDEPVQMDDLTQIDHVRRYAPSGHPVEGGETDRSWVLFVLPRALDRKQIEVGFDGDFDDDVGYPIRWVPKTD